MRLSPLALAITLTLAACSQSGTRSEITEQAQPAPKPFVEEPADHDAIVVATDEGNAAGSASDAAANTAVAADPSLEQRIRRI